MRVCVVGGGLAGLFTALSLRERGIDEVMVLEAGEPGGVARTIERGGYLLEPAVGTMMLPQPDLTTILDSFGANTMVAPVPKRGRLVWTGDELVAVVPGPGLILTPLASVRAKGRALFEPLVREPAGGDDESLEAFLVRRLGRGLGPVAAWLAASGVFAGDPDELSAKSAFPSLVAGVDGSGSMIRAAASARRRRHRGHPAREMHVPVNSMADLVDVAAGALGSRLRSGVRVEAVRRMGHRGWTVESDAAYQTDTVVLACAPGVAGSLVDGPIRETLARACHVPVVVVWLGGPSQDLPIPDGYGILTTRQAGMATRGVLLESSYAPHRAPEGHNLVKVIAGGRPTPGIVDLEDDQVVESVVDEVSRILGADISPQFTEVVRHRPGIPQYPVGHQDWLGQLRRWAPDGLYLTGWGYRGVGIAQVAADARRVAEEVSR